MTFFHLVVSHHGKDISTLRNKILILSYIPSKSWKPCGFHVDSTLFPCGYNMITMWTPCEFQVDTTWFPCGYNMITMWTPCGFQVDTTWFPCGQDHFHPLQMRSRSMDTRSRLDLFLDYPPWWIPIFGRFLALLLLLEVKKVNQSLKACNSLNNGLIFNLQKVLESSWSLLMSFPFIRKWQHHFPFSQISLKSHVTILNQPIRSLDYVKSPSSRWNLWDFARLHLKFFPHLKSKAVTTALLKINKGEKYFKSNNASCF